MTRTLTRGLLFCLFSVGSALFAAPAASNSLFFPLEKNHIQVLPQRFEYLLLDKDHFRIGDILMDANKIDFQLVSSPDDANKYNFVFRWPADLLRDGEIFIKDSSGKAIWIQKIALRDSKILEDSQGDSNYRTSTATYESSRLDNDFLNRLQYAAYFKFCIYKVDLGTRIYICSKDLYVKNDKNHLTVKVRDSFRKESYVEINGRPVDPQGAIFLNELVDNISLRALLISGATLEIDTRKKDIQYKDIVLSNLNKDELIIRAKGTEPVDKSKVKWTSPTEWETSLPLDRPILYLKGEGDIPLRQEFLINGPIRTDSVQVGVLEGWAENTYSADLQLKLKPSEGVTLQQIDRGTKLTGNQWSLRDLDKGKVNHNYLGVKSKEGQFVGAFEVYRGFPYEFSTRMMLPFFSQSQASWWLPGFRFGLNLNYDKALLKTASDPDWSALRLDFLTRFSPGLNMKDPGAGMILFYNSVSLGSNISLLGLGGFYDFKDVWEDLIPWMRVKLLLPLSASGSGYSLKTSWDFELTVRRFNTPRLFFEGGVRWLKTSLTSDSGDINYNRNLIFVGAGVLY